MALTNNIIAYWKLEGNSNDSVGSANGTDTSISYSTSNGKIGQGAGFNGTSSFINTTNISGISGSSVLTINCWAKFTSSINSQTLVTKWDYQTAGCFVLQTSSGGELLAFVANTGADPGSNTVNSTNASLSTNTWYMFTMVYDGTQTGNTNRVKLYKNGTLLTLTSGGTIPANLITVGTTVKIGSWGGTLTRFITGNMDEIGIWTRALSSTEITQLYNGGSGLQYPFGQGRFFNFF